MQLKLARNIADVRLRAQIIRYNNVGRKTAFPLHNSITWHRTMRMNCTGSLTKIDAALDIALEHSLMSVSSKFSSNVVANSGIIQVFPLCIQAA